MLSSFVDVSLRAPRQFRADGAPPPRSMPVPSGHWHARGGAHAKPTTNPQRSAARRPARHRQRIGFPDQRSSQATASKCSGVCGRQRARSTAIGRGCHGAPAAGPTIPAAARTPIRRTGAAPPAAGGRRGRTPACVSASEASIGNAPERRTARVSSSECNDADAPAEARLQVISEVLLPRRRSFKWSLKSRFHGSSGPSQGAAPSGKSSPLDTRRGETGHSEA